MAKKNIKESSSAKEVENALPEPIIEILVDPSIHSLDQQFKIVYDKFHLKVFNYIAKLTGNREDATDLLQEVFLLFYNKLPTLDLNTGRFEAWLLRVARNIVMTYNRKTEKKNSKSVPLSDHAGASETEDAIEKKEVHDKLDSFLSNLTEKERTIFILHKIEGVKYKDLMLIFELSERTIKRIIRSVLDKLKNEKFGDFLD